MIVVGVLFLLFVIGIVTLIFEWKHRHLEDVEVEGSYPLRTTKKMVWGHYGIYMIVMSVVVFCLIFAGIYFPKLEIKGYLESFYYTNSDSYQVAVDKTSSYLSQDEFTNKLISGSMEKQQLTTSISDRIAEWRNSVVDYNKMLKQYQLFQDNAVIGLFYPKLDIGIKSIVIK